MVDYPVASHTQEGLMRTLLTEFIVHLLILIKIWSKFDAAGRGWVRTLLGNLTLGLLLKD